MHRLITKLLWAIVLVVGGLGGPTALADDLGIAVGEAWVDDGLANAELISLPQELVEGGALPFTDQVFGFVDLSGLAPGTHTLYLRVQALDGSWSKPIAQSFYLAADGGAGGAGYLLQQAEAFIDADPGEGNGFGGLVASDENFDELFEAFGGAVPLDGLAPGLHTLYVRVKDSNGQWSQAVGQSFYLAGGTDGGTFGGSGYTLQQAEAFIDADPGEGNGFGGLVASDGGLDELFEAFGGVVPLDGLAPGLHTLYVRVKDSNGQWSQAVGQSFYLAGGTDGVTFGGSGYTLQQAEAFIDADPGEGNGIGGLVASDGGFDELFEAFGGAVPLDGLAPGLHTLYVRVKDSNGQWSQAVGQSFYLAGGTDGGTFGGSGYTLQQAEAFIDADPGEGNGIGGLVASDGGFDELFEAFGGAVPLDGLVPGLHTLYVRVKDSNGQWSLPLAQTFYLANGGMDDGTVENRGSLLVAAELSFNGAPFEALEAEDGAFDDVVETVSVTIEDSSPYPAWQVRFHDSLGRVGESGIGDSDQDGLPDAWELGRFGHLDEDASGDPDGDGLNNLEEYRRGSDPRVADSGGSGLFISGFVRDLAGTGLADVTLCYVHLDVTQCPVTTDALGYYRLGGDTGLESGLYRLYARNQWGSLFGPEGIEVELTDHSVTGIDFQRLAPDLSADGLVAAPDHGLAFDGVDDGVWIEDPAGSLVPPHWTLALTVVAYDEAPQGDFRQPLVWRTWANGDAHIAYALVWLGDRFGVLMEDDSGLHQLESPPVAAGERHHLAATFDGEWLKLYLDGEAVGALQANGQPPVVGGGLLWLGRFDGEGSLQAFHGELGELQVWDHARAQEEIQREMARTLVGTELGLLGYWTFEDPDAPLTDATPAALDGDTERPETTPEWVVLPPGDQVGAEVGEPLALAWRLLNQGEGKVEHDFYEYWYLSADDRLDADDRYLGRFQVSASAAPGPGQALERSGRLNLPADLTAGDYYLLLEVDGSDGELEGNEANNLAVLPLHLVVRPPVDLTADALQAPDVAQPGETLTLTWSVSNQGDGTAEAPWRETLWLHTADGRQLILAERVILEDLLPGTQVQRQWQGVLPLDQGIHGLVRFSVELDRYRVLEDADVTNNQVEADTQTEVPTALRLQGPTHFLENSGPVTFTLYRNGDASDELLVLLEASDPTALQVPSEVTLPVGAYQTTFQVQPIDDGRAHGDRLVTLSATAEGYLDGTLGLRLLDSGALFGNLADLAISAIVVPQEGDTDGLVQVGFRMENLGDAAAVGSNANPDADYPGSWQQRIYLSDDDQIGNDLLVATHEFTGVMAAGGYTDLSYPVRMPDRAGDYWIVVRADVSGRVLESDELNNVAISEQPIEVRFAYSAQVETDIDVATAGTSIPLHGTAWTREGEPAVGVRVDIEIRNGDFRRRIAAITDLDGAFQTQFDPLPNEAGSYEVGAGHPGQATFDTQDRFVLLGFSMVAETERLDLLEGASLTTEVTLTNLSDHALSGLRAQVESQPPGVTAQLQLDGDALPGAAQRHLTLTLEGSQGAESGDLVILFQTNEGVVQRLTLPVQVTPLAARLAVTPERLVAGMPLGQVRTLTFQIENRGNDATGELYIQMTDYPWLDLATANPMPSLAPGERAEVVLTLSPAADLPLGLYDGMLLLAGDQVSVGLPFEFRAVSDGQGDLQVEVVDEYFYFDDDHPKVAGARVKVYDQFTGQLIAEGVSDADGYVSFPDLANDYYRVVVSAEDHTSAEVQLLVEAGMTNSRRVFISREAVKYEWKVREIEIEDRYEITIETTFETRVPMPVVVFDPPRLDLSPLTDAGQTMQIDLKATNHGLIAAQHFRLQIEDVPGYRITPLVSQIGDIPAQSSVTVPLLIERTAPAGAESVAEPLLAVAEPYREESTPVCFVAGIIALYDYICGPDLVTKMKRIEAGNYSSPVSPLAPYCGGGGSSTTVGGGGGSSGGSGGGTSCCSGGYTGGQISQNSCDDCLDGLGSSTYDCLVSFVPLSGAYNCARNGHLCGKGLAAGVNGLSLSGCVYGVANCLGTNIPGANLFFCLAGYAQTLSQCLGLGSGPVVAGAQSVLDDPLLASASSIPAIAQGVQTGLDRVMANYGWLSTLFGDEKWSTPEVLAEIQPFLPPLAAALAPDGEEGEKIGDSEFDELLDVLPGGLTTADLTAFRDRWNRSVDYWAAGIYELDELPEGANTDFITLSRWIEDTGAAVEALDQAEEAGYESPEAWFMAEVQAFSQKDFGEEGVCAVVKLKLEQSLVLTRQGFEATLDLDNGTTAPLTQIQVQVDVYDDQGNLANDRFGITEPLLMNLDAVDGTGTLLPQSTGTAQWILAPKDEAAPDGPADYFIGGILSYREGEYDVSIDLMPVHVSVRPNAALVVHYFHQRDVYGDDPFTDEVEPSLPYSLAVLVKNQGAGTAYNLRIDSGEPEIVDNEKGLLIDFDIIAAQVAGQAIQPSLSLELGDLGPGQVALGQWFFTSSLQGHFIDYKASFTHVDPLGILTSLVKEVQIHEMVRPVQALGDLDDGLMDFLVNDDRDDPGMPDALYLSDGSVAPVALAQGAVNWIGTLSPDDPTIELQVEMGEGYRYLRTPDPANGAYRLVSVVRSDGLELPVDVDAWQTDRTFPGVQQDPVREHLLHLFDKDSTGRYTLTYAAVDDGGEDALLPIDDQMVIEGQTLELRARLADSVSGDVHFELGSGAPAGMSLDPQSGQLTWTTQEVHGPGQYLIELLARRDDGTLVGRTQFQVTVAEVNQAPRLAPVPPVVELAGALVQLTLQAQDDDIPANGIEYQLLGEVPEGLTLDAQSGELRWSTTPEDAGVHQLEVMVSDDGQPPLTSTATLTLHLVAPPRFHAGLFYTTYCQGTRCGLAILDYLGQASSLALLPELIDCTGDDGQAMSLEQPRPTALGFDGEGRLWALLASAEAPLVATHLAQLDPRDATVISCRALPTTLGGGLASLPGESALLLAPTLDAGLYGFTPDGQGHPWPTTGLEGEITALAAPTPATLQLVVEGTDLVTLSCDADCLVASVLTLTSQVPMQAGEQRITAVHGLVAALDGGLFAVDSQQQSLLRLDGATGLVVEQNALDGLSADQISGLAEVRARLTFQGTAAGGPLTLRLSSLTAGEDGDCLTLELALPSGASAEAVATALAEAVEGAADLAAAGIHAQARGTQVALNAALAQVTLEGGGLTGVVHNAPLPNGHPYPAACRTDRLTGDIDGDADVDRDDLDRLRALFQQNASGYDDPHDLNQDGVIDVLDLRLLVRRCTRPRCAVQ